MSYLFVGVDVFSKDIKIEKIKQELFSKECEHFNFDCLYARDLDLLKLQEVLLRLPVKAKRRIVLIREADKLKENIKTYLIQYFKKPPSHTLLILDTDQKDKDGVFFNKISKYVKLLYFEERQTLNTFRLSQEIDRRRINTSLKILNLLLLNGEKPERIMGGLRYCWQNSYLPYQEKNRRLRLLLNCDIDIKTGKLRPAFALERLLVSLCSYSR